MKPVLVKGVAGLLALTLVGFVAQTATATDTSETLLLAETADTATLADGVLTLSGIDDHVTWFSDRPFREAGNLTVAGFIDAWSKGADRFADDPPNAALTGVSDGARTTMVLELLDPVLEGGKLRFNYEIIEGDEIEVMEGVALLIDDFCFRC